MNLRLNNYIQGFKIVSLAMNMETKNDLLEDGLDFVFFDEDTLELYPDLVKYELSDSDIKEIKLLNNFDVFYLFEDGRLVRCYDDSSIDNCFFVTAKCNSNCVMCPSPDSIRKKGEVKKIKELIEIAKHMPDDTKHITITGGEPFMVGEEMFDFLLFLKNKFQRTDFLMLTNGRIFSVKEYFTKLCETIPSNCLVGIPLHGSKTEVHDAITQTKGSFVQTCAGITRLLKADIKVELRIVVTRLNLSDMNALAKLIVTNYNKVDHVSIMAMEMTGNARVNMDDVWISYKDSFNYVKSAIDELIRGGVNVKLYNFPLCTVEKKYWTLCKKSISPSKIRYGEQCEECTVKNTCGGVFSGTIALEKKELEPII